MHLDAAASWVQHEAMQAADKYGDFASTAEALGVLTEEYHELVEAIRSNDPNKIAIESLQLSAVALRLFRQAYEPSERFRERSGFRS